MKFLLLLLVPLFGLVASLPTNHTEIATLKNMFYELNITDPLTFKLVDRLVELAVTPHEVRDISNATGPAQAVDNMQLYSIPHGEIRCHKDQKLDYMTVMAAVAPLAQKCAHGKLKPRENWYGNDYWQTTRVYVCNWGGTNDCRLSQVLEAIAEIWNECKAGTVAGWWRTYKWKKGYGIENFEKSWCDFK
ncbi:hypothetical protein ONZ43_g5615 [Nemania bipapillata]|uniref:Uncharacterized protein n=1 Tax=Nemania bipapillata TaxID=110536 RepID=A0ACC2I8H9_9PEZI|nr:hypothetical protein ONZ43_g5615 [Nemania bipapillata]